MGPIKMNRHPNKNCDPIIRSGIIKRSIAKKIKLKIWKMKTMCSI
jgi:hypothetical protein